jgi:hypothetical protein
MKLIELLQRIGLVVGILLIIFLIILNINVWFLG